MANAARRFDECRASLHDAQDASLRAGRNACRRYGPLTLGGTCTAGDNCPNVVNGGQENDDSQPAGNACQCGNVDGVGGIDALDLQGAREYVVGRTGGVAIDLDFCDMNDDANCNVSDVFILQRIVAGQPASVTDRCAGYLTP